jgi:hypothetical protein
MTIQEKLRALLPSDKIDAAESLFTEMEEMFKKNAEDIRKWKDKAREKEGATSEEVAELERQNAALTAELKKKESELKVHVDAAVSAVAARDSLIAEKELRKALGAYTIAPDSAEEVYSLLSRNVRVDKGVATGVVTIDGKEVEKSVPDTVKHWMETSGLAKRVVVVGKSSGSGAPGSGSPSGNSKKWSDLTLTEQSVLYRDNPEQARQLMQSK